MARGGIRGALVAMVAVGGCTEPPCTARVGDLCPLVGTGELGFNRDGLAPEDSEPVQMGSALLDITVPAKTARVLSPLTAPLGGYTNYKRVQ